MVASRTKTEPPTSCVDDDGRPPHVEDDDATTRVVRRQRCQPPHVDAAGRVAWAIYKNTVITNIGCCEQYMWFLNQLLVSFLKYVMMTTATPVVAVVLRSTHLR